MKQCDYGEFTAKSKALAISCWWFKSASWTGHGQNTATAPIANNKQIIQLVRSAAIMSAICSTGRPLRHSPFRFMAYAYAITVWVAGRIQRAVRFPQELIVVALPLAAGSANRSCQRYGSRQSSMALSLRPVVRWSV